MSKIKAIALFSGGLDSAIAIKLIQEQGIEVEGYYFALPFVTKEEILRIQKLGKKLYIKLKIDKDNESFYKIMQKPKHGFGKGINPCVDCKILMMKSAWNYLKEQGADFLVSGEVLGQRPMSQNYRMLSNTIKEAGIQGYLVRPLSGKLLDKTEPEIKGQINNKWLLDIHGRSRSKQKELQEKYNLFDFIGGGGGCKLTHKEYSKKMARFLFIFDFLNDKYLKIIDLGRHFAVSNTICIVGRNKEENEQLITLKSDNDVLITPINTMGPNTLIVGKLITSNDINTAMQITARYCDKKNEDIEFNMYIDKKIMNKNAKALSENEIQIYRMY